MQLSFEMEGSFDASRDLLQRNFLALQRTFDDLQNQVIDANNRIIAVRSQLTQPDIVVASNGQIANLPRTDPMHGIVHDSNFLGLGTPESPLVSVATSPNSSGFLAVVTALLTAPTIEGMASTPYVLLGGSTGVSIVPVWGSLNWHVSEVYSNSPSWRWGYTGAAGNFFITLTPGLTSKTTLFSTNASVGHNAIATSVHAGKGVDISLNIAPTVVASPRSAVNVVISLCYYTVPTVL